MKELLKALFSGNLFYTKGYFIICTKVSRFSREPILFYQFRTARKILNINCFGIYRNYAISEVSKPSKKEAWTVAKAWLTAEINNRLIPSL